MSEPIDATNEKRTGAGTSDSGFSGVLARGREALPDVAGHLIFWPIAVLGLVLDLWSKHAVFAAIEARDGRDITIIKGFFSFTRALNEGAAFGLASGKQMFLIAVAAAALVVIFGVFFFGSQRQRLVQFSLGMFAAGVCGNLWDRIFNDGLVRDFIDVVYWPGRHWHTFNVADALLCVGVGLLIVGTMFTGSSDRKHDRPQKSAP